MSKEINKNFNCVFSENLYSCWIKNLRYILEHGEPVKDERGDDTIEVIDLLSVFNSPFIKIGGILALKSAPDYWTGQKLENYIKQFNSKEKSGFVYTYGNRIRDYESPKVSGYQIGTSSAEDVYSQVHLYKINQVNEVIRKLSSNKHSRRAVITTWNPYLDNNNDEVPCLNRIEYLIRNNKLITVAEWRSHDIFGAYYPNCVGLAHQTKEIAEKLYVDIGEFRIRSVSAHIRGSDLDDPRLEKLLIYTF